MTERFEARSEKGNTNLVPAKETLSVLRKMVWVQAIQDLSKDFRRGYICIHKLILFPDYSRSDMMRMS